MKTFYTTGNYSLYFLVSEKLVGDLVDWCADNNCIPHQIPEPLFWMKMNSGYPLCFVFLSEIPCVFDEFLKNGMDYISATKGFNPQEGNFLMDFSYN